jgi:lipopolysaccharide transport system ATP-binding protein
VGLKYKLKRPVEGSRIHWALRDVSLDLHGGETLGVIGSNGAGKSTLMKLIAGIIQQDHGKISRKRGLRTILLAIGTGFEGTLTGRENAILSGMLLGLHRRTIEKRLSRIIEFSELGEFIDQPIYTYSSGMRARLGFSVAMEVEPDVLLLDEVLGVGDQSFIEKSSKALLEKIRSNLTVVFISHDPMAVKRICTRATWINRGITQCSGGVDDVLGQYNAFVHGAPAPYPPYDPSTRAATSL